MRRFLSQVLLLCLLLSVLPLAGAVETPPTRAVAYRSHKTRKLKRQKRYKARWRKTKRSRNYSGRGRA